MIELMIVVLIMGVLASLSIQTFWVYRATVKRTEARLALSALWDQQEAYKLRYERYAETFDELGFDIEGAQRLSPWSLKARIYEYNLASPPPYGPQSWYCSATGNIDEDAWMDVIVVERGYPGE